MDASALIPALAALLGTAIGGAVTYHVARLQLDDRRHSERTETLLSKLEETHEVLRSIKQAYRESQGSAVLRLNAPSVDQRSSGELVQIERLQMLVGFYFPSLSQALQEIESARRLYGKKYAESITSKEDASVLTERLLEAYEPLDASIDAAMHETAVLAAHLLETST